MKTLIIHYMVRFIHWYPVKFNFSDFANREEAISSVEDSIELIVDCYSKDTLLDNYLDQETIDSLRFILNDISEGIIKWCRIANFHANSLAESTCSSPFLALRSTKASAGNHKQILPDINNKKLHIIIALS